jgi:antitoxin VapB
MGVERNVRLFRNGRNQAVRIPREFEFAGKHVVMRKVGDKLILEPAKKKKRLAELLASWGPIEEDFPEIPDPPPRPEDIF